MLISFCLGFLIVCASIFPETLKKKKKKVMVMIKFWALVCMFFTVGEQLFILVF